MVACLLQPCPGTRVRYGLIRWRHRDMMSSHLEQPAHRGDSKGGVSKVMANVFRSLLLVSACPVISALHSLTILSLPLYQLDWLSR